MSSVPRDIAVDPYPRHNRLVTFLTFGSILGILAVWLRLADGTIFWVYSILIAGFLICLYGAARGYRPTPDIGFRPMITVVIPAKNEEGVIDSVIRTVFRSDYPSSRMEVIVVDDGSTDRTWEKVRELASDPSVSDRLIIVKHERNYGKRVALASAVSRARGEIIVCIDSDSFVDHDAIKLLVQPLENPSIVAVCGHGEAANLEEGLLPRVHHYWYAEMFRLLKGMESRLGVVDCCSGMLAGYRRSAILPVINQWLQEKETDMNGPGTLQTNAVSPLGRGLTGRLIRSPGEDRILTTFAISSKGAKAVYQSNAIVRTVVPRTFGRFLKQQLRWNRAWVHGSVLASKFMWRKSVPASATFYLYQFLAVLTPLVVVFWVVVKPLQGAWLGELGFFAGTMLVGLLHGLNTWSYGRTTLASIPYRMLFVFVSIFLTLTVLIYAWATPWKMGWITRTERDAREIQLVPQMVTVRAGTG